MTPAEMIEKYLRLRNKVTELKQKHELELQPYKEVMERIEANLLDHLGQTNLDSVKSEAGTAFKQTVTSVTVKDWPATLDYVRENEAWDLLEARVAKNAALTVIEETDAPIPGVRIAQTQVLRVRTAGA